MPAPAPACRRNQSVSRVRAAVARVPAAHAAEHETAVLVAGQDLERSGEAAATAVVIVDVAVDQRRFALGEGSRRTLQPAGRGAGGVERQREKGEGEGEHE
jgi:hypothetical protein